MDPASISALTFDVFGTVVDWRSSITREGQAFGKHRGLSVDWAKFADAWRGLYQPAMEEVRSGRRPWMRLDDLHRESLVRLLARLRDRAASPGARSTTSTAPGTGSIRGRTWWRVSPASSAATSWPRSRTATSR